jgi:hypothetical protein
VGSASGSRRSTTTRACRALAGSRTTRTSRASRKAARRSASASRSGTCPPAGTRTRSCSPARVSLDRVMRGMRSLRVVRLAWRQASAQRRRRWERNSARASGSRVQFSSPTTIAAATTSRSAAYRPKVAGQPVVDRPHQQDEGQLQPVGPGGPQDAVEDEVGGALADHRGGDDRWGLVQGSPADRVLPARRPGATPTVHDPTTPSVRGVVPVVGRAASAWSAARTSAAASSRSAAGSPECGRGCSRRPGTPPRPARCPRWCASGGYRRRRRRPGPGRQR